MTSHGELLGRIYPEPSLKGDSICKGPGPSENMAVLEVKHCDTRLGGRAGEGTREAGEPRSLCDMLG